MRETAINLINRLTTARASKKHLLIALALLVVVLVNVLMFFGFLKQEEHIRESDKAPAVEPFEEIETDFTHMASEEHFPFLGGAVIDIDSDGAMEVFVSGGEGQPNGLLRYENGALIDISEQAGLTSTEASYGAVAIDFENDGDTDLLLAQSSGIWLYTNNNSQFSGQVLNLNRPGNSVPLAIGLTDLNRDNLVDLYISNFVDPANFRAATFNDPQHAKANLMLVNAGDGEFEDLTQQTATAGLQNSFHSAFIDLDNNGHQDLVVANNTGAVEVFYNRGDFEFEKIETGSGLGYWMGLAAGDIDKDGDQDLFLSNIGSSIPEKLVRGDLEDDQALNLEWLLLENNRDEGLNPVTADYSLDGYGFGWGAVFEDINLDGELDLLVAQNYIKWPKHKASKLPNKAFIQVVDDENRGFYHDDALALNNPFYGQSPLIADMNGDGKPDVLWLNMDGPARAFINQSKNNFLKVRVPDQARYLGATLAIETDAGPSYSRQVMANIGFATDQTPNVFFGLGQSDKIKTLNVTMADGEQRVIKSPEVNTTITLD